MSSNEWFESSPDKYKWFDIPVWWRARLHTKLLPEEDWLVDDLYLGYGFDTPITRLRRPPRKMHVTSQEMEDARLHPRWRTWCAHHAIPLNKCRVENYWLPWKCEHERELFEKCRFKDYLWRHRLRDLIILDAAEQARRVEEAKLREARAMAEKSGPSSGGGHH